MQAIDWLFLSLLFIAQPVNGAFAYRHFLSLIRQGGSPDRISIYTQTMILQWVALLVLGITWLALGRPLSVVGFTWPTQSGWFIGAVVLVLGSAFLLYSLYSMRRLDAEERREQRELLGDVVYFLPQTRRELNYSFGMSATAGLIEEIIYRGYVLWCLTHYMPVWLAVAVSSIGFGLGHLYQGIGGAIKVAGAGLVFCGIYLATGSLLYPILAHFLMDLLQMLIVYEMHQKPEPNSGE